MSNVVAIGVIRVVVAAVTPLLNSLWLMLIWGAILGHYNLWTPSYWDTVGAVYSVLILSSLVIRNGYYTVKGNFKSDEAYNNLKNKNKRKPVI